MLSVWTEKNGKSVYKMVDFLKHHSNINHLVTSSGVIGEAISKFKNCIVAL